MIKALQKTYTNAQAIHIQHKNIAYPRIIIKADLSLFVRVPLHFSHTQVWEFITKNHQWIESTLHKLHSHHLALHSQLNAHQNQIPIFGFWCDISTLLPKTYSLFTPSLTDSTNPTFYTHTLKTQLKAMLRAYIYPRVEEYASLMGGTYRSIKITHARSRFGSCSHDNRLCFSFMLIFAQKELIDYVIIHELAHIRHKNHSRSFWDYVTTYCKKAKSLRLALRQDSLCFCKNSLKEKK